MVTIMIHFPTTGRSGVRFLERPTVAAALTVSYIISIMGASTTAVKARVDIKTMAKHADKEGNPLYPVPVLLNAKELEQFYYKVADRR